MAATATQQPSCPTTTAIERAIDREKAGAIPVTSSAGGLALRSMQDVMEFAKLMAVARQAIPVHLRENVGACLAICIQAVEWRMSPFAVANKSYVVNDRLGFESQLVHAVIEQRAPLLGRLRHSFSGEGAKRKCKVWAHVRGEAEPLEYESPEFGTIQPKNSPLWKTKPDLQLYYNTSRDWARAYFPDVILGVYTDDELEDGGRPAAGDPLPVGRVDLRAAPGLAEVGRAAVAPSPADGPPAIDGNGLSPEELARINDAEADGHLPQMGDAAE